MLTSALLAATLAAEYFLWRAHQAKRAMRPVRRGLIVRDIDQPRRRRA